jgi:hypothetical protein
MRLRPFLAIDRRPRRRLAFAHGYGGLAAGKAFVRTGIGPAFGDVTCCSSNEGQSMTKPKILIAFYSRAGSTEALANAVAEGATAADAEIRLRRVREFVGPEIMAKAPGWAEAAEAMNAKYEAPTEADAEWADGIIFGTPTRFGALSSELKAFIEVLAACGSRAN